MNLVQVLHIFVTSKTRTLGYNDTIALGTNPVIPSRQIKINQSKKLEKCKCVFYGLNRVLSWLCRLSKKSFVRFVVSLSSFTGLKSSPTSLDKYRSARMGWKQWASRFPCIDVFPAKPFLVALYLKDLLSSASSVAPITSAVYGIQWAHQVAAQPFPTDHHHLKVYFHHPLKVYFGGL